jgi:hypothetical protein
MGVRTRVLKRNKNKKKKGGFLVRKTRPRRLSSRRRRLNRLRRKAGMVMSIRRLL